MQENNRNINQEDEIDLRELFLTLWKNKVFIVVITAIITILAGIYAYFKNPTPIYQGKLYLEIGKIQDKNFVPVLIENTYDISSVLNLELNVQSNPLKGTIRILEVSFSNENKDLIENKLQEVKEFVILKHKNETEFYDQKIMTKQIGEINISSEAINKPKKKLILAVSFVTGFILSIFLVFFREFIRGLRN